MAVAERDLIIILAPVFAWLWVKLGHEPAGQPDEVRVGPDWRRPRLPDPRAGRADGASAGAQGRRHAGCSMVYLLHTLGELCLSPVGLSSMTKLAPARIVSLMMGVWFLAASVGNFLAWHRPRRSTKRCRCRRLLTGGRDSADRRCRLIARCCVFAEADASRTRPIAWASDASCDADPDYRYRMALDEYKRKRDFKKSPEPAGDQESARDAQGQAALLLRAEAPRQPSALRLPPRARRRAAVVGRAEGPVARSENQAAGDARRGSPDRVRHVRRRDSRRLRRRASSCSGTRARGRRKSDDVAQGAGEGRPEVHARRLQAQGIVGPGPDAAATAAAAATAELAAHQAPRRLGGRRRHHRVCAAVGQVESRFSRDSGRRQPGRLGNASAG